jgi:ribosome-binding factor A
MGAEGRTLRVAALIQRSLGPLLQQEARERRLGIVSITSVTVSPDLRHAKVYVSALATGVAEPVAPGSTPPVQPIDQLQRAAGRYRTHVAKALGLRIAPRLAIVADDTEARAARINALLARP